MIVHINRPKYLISNFIDVGDKMQHIKTKYSL